MNESIPTSPVSDESLPVALVEPAECRFRTLGAAIGSLALILLAYVIGVYATSLNREFYVHHSPFFDSCSYYNIMASTIVRTKAVGVFKALPKGEATMCLPWLEVAVLTKIKPDWVTLQRSTGLWIQISWLVPMLLSLFFYFYAYRKHDAVVSFALCVPFACPAILWSANGGFSDFRMDMGFYFFFAMTGAWFMATMETESWLPWIMLGISAGLAGLERATAPVFLAFAFGPPMLVWLIFSPRRWKVLMQAMVAALVAIAVCGWWFKINWTYIYYYYAVWNRDSMTGMAFMDSFWGHFETIPVLLGHTVRPMCWWLGGILLITVSANGLGLRLRQPKRLLREFNWTALWLGYAPTLQLVAQRAGMNLYVGYPAIFGLILFPLTMDIHPLRSKRSIWVGVLFVGLTLGLLVNSALSGMAIHTAIPVAPMEAHMPAYKGLCDRLIADANAHGKKTVLFGGTQLMGLHSIGLGNVLIFDYGFAPSGNVFAGRGIEVQVDSRYQPAVPVEWVDDSMPGADTKAKADWLVKHQDEVIEKMAKEACERVDYIVIPNETTAKFAFEKMQHNYANLTAPALSKRILELGHFEPLGGPIEFSKEEVITLYANRRTAATQPVK